MINEDYYASAHTRTLQKREEKIEMNLLSKWVLREDSFDVKHFQTFSNFRPKWLKKFDKRNRVSWLLKTAKTQMNQENAFRLSTFYCF